MELEVKFIVKVPSNGASMEQIEEWLKHKLCLYSCSSDNPLVDEDLEAKFGSLFISPVSSKGGGT